MFLHNFLNRIWFTLIIQSIFNFIYYISIWHLICKSNCLKYIRSTSNHLTTFFLAMAYFPWATKTNVYFTLANGYCHVFFFLKTRSASFTPKFSFTTTSHLGSLPALFIPLIILLCAQNLQMAFTLFLGAFSNRRIVFISTSISHSTAFTKTKGGLPYSKTFIILL